MYFDFPLEQLKVYKPDRQEPSDFDAFWSETIAQAKEFPLAAQFEPVDYRLQTLETYDITFNGFGGQPVKGWFLLPRHRTKLLPCVVEFIGYGGGRGYPYNWLLWSSIGFAHLIMDTRGQGSVWLQGDTPDLPAEGNNPHFPGFMTMGVLDPKHITTGVFLQILCAQLRQQEAIHRSTSLELLSRAPVKEVESH